MVNDFSQDDENASKEFDADQEDGPRNEVDPPSIELTFQEVGTEHAPCVEVTAGPTGDVRHLLVGEVLPALIARVTADRLTMYPVNVNPTKPDFLRPKYQHIHAITLEGCGAEWELPLDRYAFDELLESLPVGFSRKARYGLGLKWAYRLIPGVLAEVPTVCEIVMSDGVHAAMEPPVYRLGYGRFDALRRALDGIARRAQRTALEERARTAYNELVSTVDPLAYPAKQATVRPGTIVKLVQVQGDDVSRNAADRRAILTAARGDAKRSAKDELPTLLELGATIERVALDELTDRLDAMLGSRHLESSWQAFFKSNPFILGLAFAYPLYLIQDQAFVGNISLRGDGHSIVDFLMAQRCSGNIALIEIKHPETKLLEKSLYRGRVRAPHRELTGAITQVLHQRYSLVTSIAFKTRDSALADADVAAVHCIVIAGRSPSTVEDKRSFELFRNAAKDVFVVTFDELLEKLKQLRRIIHGTVPNDPATGTSEA